jgi:hypothetical protein
MNKDAIKDKLFDEFWGPHSIFSIVSFITGGILIGRTLWEIIFVFYGPVITIIIGFVLISLGGMALNEFND